MKYTRQELMDLCGILLPDQYDSALIGYAESCGKTVAVYDREAVINLVGCDTREESQEFFEFNILGSYLHGSMPVYFTPCRVKPLPLDEPPQDLQDSASQTCSE